MKSSILVAFASVLIIFPAMAESESVPQWVKNNAGWWADGDIPDSAFIDGIEFLINDGIIIISNTQQNTTQSLEIPSWVKNNAGWWADGDIPDSAFIDGIEFLINDGIIQLNQNSSTEIVTALLTWDEIILDSKYAYDGSVELNNILIDGAFPMNLHIQPSTEKFTDFGTYEFISNGVNMYKLTGDDSYLEQARITADFIEKNSLTNRDLLIFFNPFTGEAIERCCVTNNEILGEVSSLALLDSEYIPLVEKLADEILEDEINSQTNFIYTGLYLDSEPAITEMYLSYGGANALESLLLAYEATSNPVYLEQVKKTIIAYWDTRDKETNLIPSMINADTSVVEQDFMQQYGAGIFLKILLHYYYLTDDPEIFQIIKLYSDSVIENFWDGTTWNYRVNTDGTILSHSIEANFGKLDDALFLLHDLDPKIFNNAYSFAKSDYDNSLQNELVISNNLIIHSVKDDGSKDSPQSMMNYAFLVNQNIGIRLYHDTSQIEYLSHLHDFYDSVILNHKREFGYIHGIDAYSLNDADLGNLLNTRAPSQIANKVIQSFVSSKDVNIIWTIIGNHEISQPFITMFSDSGRFNNIDFDYKNRSIDMKTVYGKGTITFANKIESVLIDGMIYNDFNNYTLNTLDGKHRYQVFLYP